MIDINDNRWNSYTDPAWTHRLSLHEIQIRESLELAYHLAKHLERQTALIPQIVTSAIAALVPANEVSNRELARILFGDLEQANKRLVRHFRNEERPLKLGTAAAYIQRLLYAKRIMPSEAGRLWYLVLLYNSAMSVIADYFRNNDAIDVAMFERDQNGLITPACTQFKQALEASLQKSSNLEVNSHPHNEVRQFLDACAFLHWQESKVKRNPWVSIHLLIDLAQDLDKYKFSA